MNALFALCIRRPVLACVLSLVVLLIGAISYTRLDVREYPRIDEPVVSVDTVYIGASAEIVESQITKVIEDSLAGIEGVEIMTSQSRAERSAINVRFRLTRDPDSAASDVRDKVARVRARLPDGVDEPVVSKVESDSSPVVWIAVAAGALSELETSDYLARYVKPRLSVLPGAADVRIFGERKPAMRIWLDRDRLAAQGLTAQDVEQALRQQNVEIPSGRIESKEREFSIVAQTDVQTEAQFEQIVLSSSNGYPVRLRDVARIEIGPADDRVISRSNGQPGINVGVIKQATANPLELSKSVRAEIERLNTSLPPGMSLEVTYDTSVFIQKSIDSVFRTIGEAVLLVALVTFVFLRNLRATLIPLVTIPVSLIGAFGLMAAFGFTINTLSLLAMVLAIGLVVDDAIVVLENIYRNIEEGMPPIPAALRGMKEIGFAVIAMTLTLAAVYAPLAFASGRTGRLFIEFALTLAGAVLVSGFVALTLSPMMCSRLLRHETRHGWLYNRVEAAFESMTRAYSRLVGLAVVGRLWVLLIWVGVVVGMGVLFFSMKSELAPLEDRGVIIGRVQSPPGATVRYTADNLRAIEDAYARVPEMAAFNAIAGFPTVADGNAVLRLKPWESRERSQMQIAEALRPIFMALPGVSGFPVNPPSLGQSFRSTPIEFILMSQVPYPELQKLVQQFMNEMARYPGIQNLQSDLRLNTPELRVQVDRDKLADVGIPVEAVGQTLQTMLGGRQVTRFKKEGEQYDVIVQMTPDERSTPDDISQLYVRTSKAGIIPLSNVVSVQESVAPQSLNHFNRLRAVTLTGTLAPGYALGEALQTMQDTARRTLPPTAQTDLSGQSREFRDSSGSIVLIFALALGFIYLVLAAQFESFVDPFIIMLSVPLSMAGALLALHLTGGTLNIYSQIGLITLVGLITKHGILIVEFANQRREQGVSKLVAVQEAATLRLRPILMTTGAMVLGALPLAFAHGAGAESRSQIGWVIVGGMSIGTLLTLFVVPAFYALLSRSRPPAHTEATTDPTLS